MIDAIFSSLKGEFSNRLLTQFNIPQDKVDDTAVLAKDSITNEIQNQVSQGNISGLTDLFSGQNLLSSPIVKNMIQQYGTSMVTKLGFSNEMASGISQFAIPFIIQKFTDSNKGKSFDQETISKLFGDTMQKGLTDQLKDGIGKNLGSLGGLFN
ncbi:hypothetical protein [Flexithrix dorotheae]|uniref:hypothetical protein n=1 Tax=Flexithrix dorotheae TaxID=70993 RepID=UPI00036AB615|nr:hypothetical protein [Flexithrix dorotheae]